VWLRGKNACSANQLVNRQWRIGAANPVKKKKKGLRVFNPLVLAHGAEESPILLEVQLHLHTPHVAKNKARCAEQGMPFLQHGGSWNDPLGLALEQLAGV